MIANVFTPPLVLAAANKFLGLRSPTEGTCFAPGNDCGGAPIGDAISGIVGNIIGDLFIIAAFVAAMFVIYGGIMYVISMGDSGKMAGAKDTLTRALMGFFLSLIANVIVTVILTAMNANQGKAGEISDLGALISEVLMLVGILGVVMTIISGILYGISAGDTSKVTKAKNALITSLAGTVIAFMATAIINLIGGTFAQVPSNLAGLAGAVIPVLMWVTGVISVVGLVVAGIMYSTAAGDESKIVRAKNYIKFALVGLAVALLAFVLQTFVLDAVGA